MENKRPDYEMYNLVIAEFGKYMKTELAANYLKGDRELPNGWLSITGNKEWISDLYYHVGKLQNALMTNDIDRIKENCADVANIALMILDIKINLLNAPLSPPPPVATKYHKNIPSSGD